MKHIILYISIALLIALPLSYAIYWTSYRGLDLFDQFWLGAMGNLLATVVGVAVGIPAGLWVNRAVETSHQRLDQSRTIHNLRNELDQALTHDLLKDPLKPQVPPIYIDTGAWKASSASGDTNSIQDAELLAKIINAYYRIESLNEWLGRFYDASYGTGSVIKFTNSATGQQTPLATEVSKVLLNLASQHRPYIEMVSLKLRKLERTTTAGFANSTQQAS